MITHLNTGVKITTDGSTLVAITRLVLDKDPVIMRMYPVSQQEIYFDFPYDGVFQIYQIQVPTETTGYTVTETNVVRNSDNTEVYNFVTGNVNNEAGLIFLADSKATPASVFAVTELTNCHRELVTRLLDLKMSGQCKIPEIVNHEESLLYMGITALKFCSDNGLIYEALRIITTLTAGCTLCQDTDSVNCNC